MQPYQRAVKFLDNLDPALTINETVAAQFFNKFDLYKRRDKQKFERALRSVKKMAHKNNLQHNERDFIAHSIRDLEKVENFIVEYATTYYARMVYNDIASHYSYADDDSDIIVDMIVDKPWLLNIPSAKDRGLYHFVKKIDLDVRRLSVLFSHRDLPKDIEISIDQLITKLTVLKDKIVVTSEYKKQLSKTRWLKACGIVFVPMLFLVPFGLLMACTAPASVQVVATGVMILLSPIIGLLYATTYASLVTTIQDIREAREYDIPMHARSVFSLVAWQGWAILIGSRLLLIAL